MGGSTLLNEGAGLIAWASEHWWLLAAIGIAAWLFTRKRNSFGGYY